MRIGVIAVFTDYHRRGAAHRGALQPQIGPLIAALLPADAEIEIVNDTWEDPDWSRDYDLLFVSFMHSDFDRARQIAHYYRKRGATTVAGGIMASTFPALVAPYFDAIVIGDPEDTVPAVYRDFARRCLQPVYRSRGYRAEAVPTPRLDLAAAKMRVPLAFEVTRGCPFACDFCGLTAFGTRFQTRPVARVLADIHAGRALVERSLTRLTRNIVMFYDNNLGGNPAYLREFCAAIAPLGLRWASCVTFNVIANRDLVRTLYRAGCRSLFVGLESFNPAALEGMAKPQNIVAKMAAAIRGARAEGILVMAGLMASPLADDCEYIESIPDRLAEVGLHVPSFVAFETPIPGTPFFRRLARAERPALLPNALLRDFSGYTLTVRPTHAEPETFVDAYVRTLRRLYAPARRMRKLASDLPRLAARGSLLAAAVDMLDQLGAGFDPAPGRTFIAGTDRAPPETVPLTAADFRSREEHDDITRPWAVTDAAGRILPRWLDAPQPARVAA